MALCNARGGHGLPQLGRPRGFVKNARGWPDLTAKAGDAMTFSDSDRVTRSDLPRWLVGFATF